MTQPISSSRSERTRIVIVEKDMVQREAIFGSL